MEELVMELTDFWALRREYEARARDRVSEYMNSGSADATFQERVITEMCIDVLTRIKKVEDLLGSKEAERESPPPPPEVEDAEKPAKKRFF
jgi:hypothetical protein